MIYLYLAIINKMIPKMSAGPDFKCLHCC